MKPIFLKAYLEEITLMNLDLRRSLTLLYIYNQKE